MRMRKIKRLWNGCASLRDYEVEKALVEGGIRLQLQDTDESMTLTSSMLRHGLSFTGEVHRSKYNKGQEYKLIDFRWRKDKAVDPQINFLDK